MSYQNPASQDERQEELERDTYLRRAQADADMAAGGRFKKETETHVVGVPQYPRQPDNSPWATPDPSGPEAPFPIDIEFVGELGGDSPAPVVSASTVETACATDGGGSPTALTDPPQLIPKRRV